LASGPTKTPFKLVGHVFFGPTFVGDVASANSFHGHHVASGHFHAVGQARLGKHRGLRAPHACTGGQPQACDRHGAQVQGGLNFHETLLEIEHGLFAKRVGGLKKQAPTPPIRRALVNWMWF
jgi:hypothetical protein